MPLYEYECDACGRRFELIRRFSDLPAEKCALCGSGPVRKLFSSPAIQFKGSGWYITDYAKKDQQKDQKDQKDQKTGAKTEGGTSGETADAKDKAAKKTEPAEKTGSRSGTSKKAPAPSPLSSSAKDD